MTGIVVQICGIEPTPPEDIGHLEPEIKDDVLEMRGVKSRLNQSRERPPFFRRDVSSPDEMMTELATIRRTHGLIERIDIVDHGKPGSMRLSGSLLFRATADPAAGLERSVDTDQLASMMGDVGQLRLLGCKTALERAGRLLVYKLSQALGGHRVVLGTIRRVRPIHFAPTTGDFLVEHDVSFLFSSLAAWDVDAPDQAQRDQNVATLS